MHSANIGWLFYRDYFEGLDYADLKSEANKEKINKRVDNIIAQSPKIEEGEVLGNMHFKATTTYPGLLLGSGNVHELPSVEGQAILGFHFDYTTGLPVIPGSSLKGLLRSAFKHPDYIREILGDKEIDVAALDIEIFGQKNGTLQVSKGQDIFFGAEIIGGGQVLGDDYLTPHGDGITEPIPLRFIKVMPGVSFRFDFELHSGLISKNAKLELFKHIIADLGIGAKTNVGYGKFGTIVNYQTKEEKALASLEREEESFEEAMASETLDKLEAFRSTYPKSAYLEAIDQRMEELKRINEQKDIRSSFESLDKKNKKYLESFINKYQENELAKEFVEEARKLLEGDKGTASPVADLTALDDAKGFKQAMEELSKAGMIEGEKASIRANAIRIYNESNKKKKKSFFKDVQIARFLGTEFEAEIKVEVGAD